MTFTSSKPEISYSMIMAEPICQLIKDYPGLLEKACEAVPFFDKLRSGEALALDYACLENARMQHGLRMKCVTTPASLQWCFKEISFTGEGSGDYYPLNYQSKLKEILFRRLCYFHRRTPLSEKMHALHAKFDSKGNPYPEPQYGFIPHTD